MNELPQRLHAAYGWIDMAREWTEALTGGPDYVAACIANARYIDDGADVYEEDLVDVIEWVRKNERLVFQGATKDDVVRQIEERMGPDGSHEDALRIYEDHGGSYLASARACVLTVTHAQWDAAQSRSS